VFEESGVAIDSVTYHSSQPWPYPSQLMLGCIAKAKTDEITVDRDELERKMANKDAMWVKRDEILKSLNNESKDFKLPQPTAIAHSLLKAWAQQ
jgi:NAD+ diphosphatase